MNQCNPDGWGQDALSQIYNQQDELLRTTFNLYRNDFIEFNKIENLFIRLKNQIKIGSLENVSAFVFSHSYTAFVASIRLAAIGQRVESYMVGRGCLEEAIYAHEIHKSRANMELWVSRHDNASARKNYKNHFRITSLMNSLPEIPLREATKKLYETSIDMGAHPNPKMLHSSVSLAYEEGQPTLGINFPNIDEDHLPTTLKFCAQVGITMVKIGGLTFPEEFSQANLQAEVTQIASELAI